MLQFKSTQLTWFQYWLKKTNQKKHHNTDIQIGCCSITNYKYMKVFKTLQQIESSEKFKKKTKNTTKFLQDQLNIFWKSTNL